MTTRGSDEPVPRQDALAVRPARAGDVDAIHNLHAGCFVDIFAGLLGDFLPPERTPAPLRVGRAFAELED